MPVFSYKGRAADGDRVGGRLEADNASAAAQSLIRAGIVPIDVEPVVVRALELKELQRALGLGLPSIEDLVLFTRQLHTVVKAGLPFLSGLRGIAASTQQPVLREALSDIVMHLHTGRELSECLSRHPEIFPELYVQVVRVGESTGTLERSLAELAQYLQEDKIVKDAISSALRYPMMVVIAIALAIGIITTFVIPRFAPLFEILGDDIPLPTLILLGASTFAAENGLAVIATLALTIFGLNRYAQTPPGRRLFDRFKLRLPVVGTLVLQGSIARVLRSLSISLNAGLPMIEALSTIARTAGNAIVAEKVLMIRDAVERGDSMQRALAAAELFPPLVLQMVSTGEETGAMPEMLAEVADYYQRETSNSLKNLTAMIEPLLVIAVGGIVLILALGVFLPMWNMISKVGAAAA